MDPAALASRMRDHYVAEFRCFVQTQVAICPQGVPELKLRLSEKCALFDRLYCVDFIRGGSPSPIVEFAPKYILIFDALRATFGNSLLLMKHLRWDDVLIRHDVDQPPYDDLAKWFRSWFDPEDERHDPNGDVSKMIHSMLLQLGLLSIDFGTAPPDAFWEIL
ncbi:hypothetical protein, partial [Rhizobium sp. Pop5]